MGFRWDLLISSAVVVVVAIILRFILPPTRRVSTMLASQYVCLAILLASGMFAPNYSWMLVWAIVTGAFSIVVVAELLFSLTFHQ
jgi:nitric oxide reductase large subunit